MALHQLQPFRSDKNLGKAYNDSMALVPDGDHACLRDIDTLLLTPNTPVIIDWYANRYPNALLTCYTNRVSTLSKDQLLNGTVNEDGDIREHIRIAENMETINTATVIRRTISGFLMVLPKSLWKQFPFPETGQCLGIDTDYSKLLLRYNVPILRMDGVYCFHIYRLMNGIFYKKHLQ